MRPLQFAAVASFALAVLMGCNCNSEPRLPEDSTSTASAATATATSSAAPSKSIGSAKMEADGTLLLRLRAESPDGAVGEGFFRYPKDHAEYDKILKHVGPIKPGEEKPVAPFPD